MVLLWDSGGDGDMAMVGDNEEDFQSFRMLGGASTARGEPKA